MQNRACFTAILWLIILCLFVIPDSSVSGYENPAGDIEIIIIEGTVTPDQQYTYRLEPFYVPEGTGALEIEFDYEGRREFAEMEIGLFDPDGFRGTSRFSKDKFYVSKYRATASYFPGPVSEGEWNISLGFPTITKEAAYSVTIRLIPENHPAFYGPSDMVLNPTKRWYKGDFHTHTGHSDAFGCHDTEGNRSPCQVWQVAEAAHKNGLDFVAITDHNTVSHHQDITIAQPAFPELLLIRGQEVTTFYGHANVTGTGIPLDFRIGFNDMPVRAIQEESGRLGALFSINHPGRETGARCTGCGWSAGQTDYNLADAIEIVNGTNVETEIAGIPFWHERLNEGYMITGIGGSDDHGGGFGRAQPGTPTTMVFAESLSEKDILDAVRKGRVYLKTRNALGTEIEFTASANDKEWQMGDLIRLNEIQNYTLKLRISHDSADDVKPELIYNGDIMDWDPAESVVENGRVVKRFDIEKPETGWIRFNLRDQEGISVISNPIYIR